MEGITLGSAPFARPASPGPGTSRAAPLDPQGRVGRVIVPIDSAATARAVLPLARAIAADGAELVLLHVLPVATLAALDPAAQQRWVRETEEALLPVERHLRRAHRRARLVIAAGDPATETIAFAGRPTDLIVLRRQGSSPGGRPGGRSIAGRITATARCPVVLIDDDDGPLDAGPSPVVTVLEASGGRDAIVPMMARLAKALSRPLILIDAGPADDQPRQDRVAALVARARDLGADVRWERRAGWPEDDTAAVIAELHPFLVGIVEHDVRHPSRGTAREFPLPLAANGRAHQSFVYFRLADAQVTAA